VLGGQAIWILKSLICAIGVAGLWNLRSRADHQRRARMILTRGIVILGAPLFGALGLIFASLRHQLRTDISSTSWQRSPPLSLEHGPHELSICTSHREVGRGHYLNSQIDSHQAFSTSLGRIVALDRSLRLTR